MKKLFLVFFLIMFSMGCTTVQKSAGIGALIGAGAGAVIGHNTHAGSGSGALVGAAIGGLGGALVGDQIDENKQEPLPEPYPGDPNDYNFR